jgi:hypothetical protein
MKNTSDIVDIVRHLIKAENDKDKESADHILSKNFVAITRASGKEQNRDELLNTIANPPNPNITRKVVEGHDFMKEDLAIVRSVVTTADKTNPDSILGRYRIFMCL